MEIELGTGIQFMLNDDHCEIKKETTPDQYIVTNVSKDQIFRISRKEIIKQYENGVLVFAPNQSLIPTPSEEWIEQQKIVDFESLPKEYKDKAAWRLKVIKPLLSIKAEKMQKHFVARAKEMEPLRVKKSEHISANTIRRWYDAYIASNCDIISLVPGHIESGRGTRLSSDVEALVYDIITKKRKEESTVDSLTKEVQNTIELYNSRRLETDRLKCPSSSTIRRRILDLDPFERLKNSHGFKYAYEKEGKVTLRPKPEKPLDRVEVDHTKLDLIVVDEKTRLPIGRPWITILIDCATGYILGTHIGFDPPSYVSVMLALKHAFSTKSYMTEKYPDLEPWLAHGKPKLLVLDNGKEFRSQSLKDACLQMGIEIYYCPPRRPWYKGAVERFFRTLNSKLLHQLPGTTFSNILEKKKREYDPQKNAVVGYETFIKIFHRWVIEEYAHDWHTGVKGRPHDLWQDYLNKHGHPSLVIQPQWEIILGKLKRGLSIQRTGIRHQYLFYQSDELQALKKNLKKGTIQKTVKIDIKYDPTDMSKIFVYDPINGKYITIPCINQEYSKGLSEYTHGVIVAQLREKQKEVVNGKQRVKKSQMTLERLKQEKSTLQDDLANETKVTHSAQQRMKNKGMDKVVSSEEGTTRTRPSAIIVELTKTQPKSKGNTKWGSYNASTK
ncbi:Mu transposase C-terminal domain-containing protein [Paenibacillus sp. MMS20-IR301]|uniref:Mu transposase C-terminal domain-containing protein n=1 Tax=Paenibacillus sp. MMS20-IR301 TaxID=2895946 RepID=UPI0028F10AA4|nr:Mu transposase C-terminal domain-containing protein [Paenibacillus sp. MMS20-IR301]WNS46104.1 DDE-type integrase/transposase/recombinase [Paenibacillus sp. MMS20-IR301]